MKIMAIQDSRNILKEIISQLRGVVLIIKNQKTRIELRKVRKGLNLVSPDYEKK